MWKNLKSLLDERSDLLNQNEKVYFEIRELLAQPCYDTLNLYGHENLFFKLDGMSAESVLKRLPKVCKVKNYEDIDLELVNSLKISDVNGALNYLFDEGKIKGKYHNNYAIDETHMQIYDNIRGKENGKI